MNVFDQYEHAGLLVEIVHDDEGYGYGPQDYDNAGTIYSWTSAFLGDEKISEPDGIIYVDDTETEDGYLEDVPLSTWFAYHYEAAMTIPLFFSDGGSCGARIYECDEEDANCALVFTQEEINEEWGGHAEAYQIQSYRWIFAEEGDPIVGYADGGKPLRERVPDGTAESSARPYAKARIKELDHWLSGNVWSIVIREREGGKVLDSISGMIGEPDDEYIVSYANGMAEAAREEIEDETKEAAYWACRGMVTV